MPSDRSAEPWPEATYRGFSGPAQPAAPPRRRWPILLAGGTAAAILLGVGAGLLIRPNLDNTDAAESRTLPGVPIEVAKPPPPEPLHSTGKLEVLSPEQAAIARAQAPQAPPPAVEPAPPPQAAYMPAPPPPLPRVASAPPLAMPAPQPAPQAFAAARGPCAAGSPAEQMVCADPRLAEADRELNRAYRRALAAGVPQGFLRSEQRDWLGIREDAARRSPRAVANIYAQRIDELNSMADDARRDRGGDDEDDGPGD
jgi:uncharacterized protein YecT (DUF1311 family)